MKTDSNGVICMKFGEFAVLFRIEIFRGLGYRRSQAAMFHNHRGEQGECMSQKYLSWRAG